MDKRIKFTTELLSVGKTKTWEQYGIEYQESPEKLRGWWKYFRHTLANKGMLTPEKELSEDQLKRCYDLGLIGEEITSNEEYYGASTDLPSAWDSDEGKYLSIEEYCNKFGLDYESVKSCKLVGHNPNHMVYNITFKPTLNNLQIDSDEISKIVDRSKIPIDDSKPTLESDWVDRLVYTDVHINMDPSGFSGSPLYDSSWNREQVLDRLMIMVDHAIRNKRSDYLIISDLGDFLDGFRGETVRGGHKLPQNSNDKEAFDLGLEFKIRLVSELLKEYEFIYSSNCVNNNHAGDFDYFVNVAAKETLEAMFPNKVEVHNRTRFIEHFKVGKHTFIESHGKDSESMRFGFKPVLDSKQVEKIDQYCKEYGLYDGNYIEFGKGDSHQNIFDSTTSNDFQYFSYPAFSPPSNWVKVNFKNSKSGFYFFNIDKNSQTKIHHPFFF